MRAWLGFSSADADAPDLVVAGFQELDARAEAFVYNDAAKEQQWTEALVQALPGGYRKVAARQLIGMFIVVFVAERCYDSVSGVQTASVGCGIMGVVGNKGAVGVRLVYGDTPVCFVCAHLAHDAAQVERRNAQFHEVCRRLVFAPDDAGWPDPLVPRREPVGAVGVFDHAYVVWLGDLNYRVGQPEPSEPGGPGRPDPAPSTYAELLARDQLRAAMGDRQAFAGFEEAAVRFAPTYKFVPGTARYDERRRPAWCDRVLWWAPSGGIGCDEYAAAASVLMSDHRPVRARLVADVWRVGRARRQAVYLDVLRELDRYENECIPTASLDADRVDFGRVVFGSRVARRLRLANTGQVPLEYGFVATPAYARGMPAWLRIAPGSGMLLPGEAARLELSVLVDERSSAALTTLSEDLAAILVLHLTRGRDYFLQVAGRYEPSVFGCPLEILVHLRGPIRAMHRADFAACLASGQFSVPRCVWALTDFIARYGVERGCSCFERPPDRALMRVVREWLDEDQELDPAVLLHTSSSSTVAVSALPHDIGVDTACGCLVDLFRSLPEPLVPFDMYAACVEAGGVSRAAALEALEILAPGRLNVLVYLLAFLRECVERGAVTRRRVARVFAQVILRPRDVEDAVVGEGAERFVEFLLIAQGQI
ncbi:Endonuclease/exonuclease/phosphatase [Kickxella alabastrina]|uniref:Endonuclease/exonuclease/phosphatase n=1 Tax=Kickxella alabastrina TaxID=61397 RepID=UPI002220A32E|nr:Endonuclease/exonuclease/phosphatase [Kickxella alabastrina]KAI7823998.1 Endonuclease/exonuclease/phosphatase [Kickxella alabastrina]